MANYKLEVILRGTFTTIDIRLEGIEIQLVQKDNAYHYKLYNNFNIINPLDISVRLKGWEGMQWSLEIKVEDIKIYEENSTFDHKGYVEYSTAIDI